MTADTQKAFAYLEQLQRHTYDHLGIEPDWMSADHQKFEEEFIRQFYESQILDGSQSFEEFRKIALNGLRGSSDITISDYQDPAWYALIAGMVKEIEEALHERGIRLNPSPIFGSLPTGRVNGIALKVPEDDQIIILIEDGLFGFANLAAKVITRAFPFKGEDEGRLTFSTKDSDWQQELAAKPEISERFLEVLLAYILGGHPHLARPYLPEPNYDGISSVLRETMEIFVLCHEYGHIVSGHLNVDNTKKSMIADEDMDEIATSWQEEFEADIKGLDFMLEVMRKRGFDLSLSFWGVEFFFGCIDVVERAVSIIRTGDVNVQISATHPPTEMRREMLHSVLKNSVPKEYAAGPLELADLVKSILDHLWHVCEPVLQKAHRDGVMLAPAWR